MLQQFFGIIRQAGGPNDHPTLPSFLQLYKLLSVYKLIKPPKFGNCTVQEDVKRPVLSLTDFDMILKKDTSHSSKHVAELKVKLESIITTTDWECEDIIQIEHDYASATVVSCIIYYVTGFLCRKFRKKYKCDGCQKAFQSVQDNENFSAQALLVNIKSKGALIHSNQFLFSLIMTIEKYFCKNIESGDQYVYNTTVSEVIDNYTFTFPCDNHKEEIMASVINYYITMRMRQWAKAQNRDVIKHSREKKKLSKLMKT